MDDEKSSPNARTQGRGSSPEKEAPEGTGEPTPDASQGSQADRDELDKVRKELEELTDAARSLERGSTREGGSNEDPALRITRPAHHQAWVGTKDRLLRLEALALNALDKAKELVGDESETLIRIRGSALELTVEVTAVTASQGERVWTGSMQSILDQIEPGEIKSVRMENLKRHSSHEGLPRLELTLGPAPPSFHDTKGARLQVSGGDEHWVGGTFDAINGELLKHVPWWAWLRSNAGRTTMGLAFTAALVVGLFALLPPEERASALFVVSLFAAICSWVIGTALERWVLRDLEILESGAKPRLSRVLVAVTIVVGFAAAIFQLISLF